MGRVAEAEARVVITVEDEQIDQAIQKATELEKLLQDLSKSKLNFSLPTGSDISKLKTSMKSLQDTVSDSVSKGTAKGITEGTKKGSKTAAKEKEKEDKKSASKTTEKEEAFKTKEGTVEATAAKSDKQAAKEYNDRLTRTQENVQKAWQAQLDEIEANNKLVKEYNERTKWKGREKIAAAKGAYVGGETNEAILNNLKARAAEFEKMPGFSESKLKYNGKEYTWKELEPILEGEVAKSKEIGQQAKSYLANTRTGKQGLPATEALIKEKTQKWSDALDASVKEVTETLASKPAEKAEKSAKKTSKSKGKEEQAEEESEEPKQESKKSKSKSKTKKTEEPEEETEEETPKKSSKKKSTKKTQTKTQEEAETPETPTPKESKSKSAKAKTTTAKTEETQAGPTSAKTNPADELTKTADNLTQAVQERAAQQVQSLADNFARQTKRINKEGVTPFDKYFGSAEANSDKNLISQYAEAFGDTLGTFDYNGKKYSLPELDAKVSQKAKSANLKENIFKERAAAMQDELFNSQSKDNKARNDSLRENLAQLKTDVKEAESLRTQADQIRTQQSKAADSEGIQSSAQASEELTQAIRDRAIAQVQQTAENLTKNQKALRATGAKTKLSEEDAYWTATDSLNQTRALGENVQSFSKIPGLEEQTFSYRGKDYQGVKAFNEAVQNDVNYLNKKTADNIRDSISGLSDDIDIAEMEEGLDNLKGKEKTAAKKEIAVKKKQVEQKQSSFLEKQAQAAQNLQETQEAFGQIREDSDKYFDNLVKETTPEGAKQAQSTIQKQLKKLQSSSKRLNRQGAMSDLDYYTQAAQQQARYELLQETNAKLATELPFANTENYKYKNTTGNLEKTLAEADRDLVNVRRNANDLYQSKLKGTEGAMDWQKMVKAQKEQIVDPYQQIIDDLYSKPKDDIVENVTGNVDEAIEHANQRIQELNEATARDAQAAQERAAQEKAASEKETPAKSKEPETKTTEAPKTETDTGANGAAESLNQSGSALSGSAEALDGAANALSGAADALSGAGQGEGAGEGEQGDKGGGKPAPDSDKKSADVDVDNTAPIKEPDKDSPYYRYNKDDARHGTGDIALTGDEARNVRDSLEELDTKTKEQTNTVDANIDANKQNTESKEADTKASKESEKQKTAEATSNYGQKENVQGPPSLKDLVADAYTSTWNDFMQQRDALKAAGASQEEIFKLTASTQEKIQAINKAVANVKKVDPTAFEGVEVTTSKGMSKGIGGTGSIGDYYNRQLKKYANQRTKLTDEERAVLREDLNTDLTGTKADAFIQASNDRINNIKAEREQQKALAKEQAQAAKQAEQQAKAQAKAAQESEEGRQRQLNYLEGEKQRAAKEAETDRKENEAYEAQRQAYFEEQEKNRKKQEQKLREQEKSTKDSGPDEPPNNPPTPPNTPPNNPPKGPSNPPDNTPPNTPPSTPPDNPPKNPNEDLFEAKVKAETLAKSINDAGELIGLEAKHVSTSFDDKARLMLRNAEKAQGKEQKIKIDGATELVEGYDELVGAHIEKEKPYINLLERGVMNAEMVRDTGILDDAELMERYTKQYETLAKRKAGLEQLFNTEGGMFEGGKNQDLLDTLLGGKRTNLGEVTTMLESARDQVQWIADTTGMAMPDLDEIDRRAQEVGITGEQAKNLRQTVDSVGQIYDDLTDENQFRQIDQMQADVDGFSKKRKDAVEGAKNYTDAVGEVIDAGLLDDEAETFSEVAKQTRKNERAFKKEMDAERKIFENNEFDADTVKDWANAAGEAYGLNVKGKPTIQGNTAEITFEKDGKLGKMLIDDLEGNLFSNAATGAFTGNEKILSGIMSPNAAMATGLVTEKEAARVVEKQTASMEILSGQMENLAKNGYSPKQIEEFANSKGVRETFGNRTGNLEVAQAQSAAWNQFKNKSGLTIGEQAYNDLAEHVVTSFSNASKDSSIATTIKEIDALADSLLNPNEYRQYGNTYERATNYKGTGGGDVDVAKGTTYEDRKAFIQGLKNEAHKAFETVTSTPSLADDKDEYRKATKPIVDASNELKAYSTQQDKLTKGQTMMVDTANKSLQEAAQMRWQTIKNEDLAQGSTWRNSARDLEYYRTGENQAQISYTRGDRRYTETVGRPDTDVNGNYAYSQVSSQRIGTTTQDWFTGFGNKMKTLTQYLGSMAILGYGMQQMSSGVNFVKTMDKDLTNIGMTMGATDEELQNLGSTAIETGKALSTDSTNVLSAMTVYANAGETAQSIAQKSKAAIMLSNVTGSSAEETADMLQGATAQFGVSDQEALNTLEKISSELPLDFAKGIQSMSDSITNAGAVAKESGLSMQEFSAITGEVAAVTRQEGSQIGNTLKTTMARISRSKSADEEVTGKDRSNAAQAYKDVLGYDLFDANGEYKDLSETLNTLAGRWSTLTDVEKNFIAEQSAGTRGLNVFRTMMDNWGEIQRLSAGALSDMDYADENQEKWNQSLEGKAERLKASYQGMFNDILSADTMGFISDLGSTAVNTMGKVTKATDDVVTGLTSWLPGGFGDFLGDAAGLATLGGGVFSLFRTGAEFKKNDYTQLGRALSTGFAPIVSPFEDVFDWLKRRGKANDLASAAASEFDRAIANGEDMSGIRRQQYINAYRDEAYNGTQFGWLGNLLSRSNDLSFKGLLGSFGTGLKSLLPIDSFRNFFKGTDDVTNSFKEMTQDMGGFNKLMANIGRFAPIVAAAGVGLAAWNDINTSQQRSIEASDEAYSNYQQRRANIQQAQNFYDQNGAVYENLAKGVNTATNKNIALTNDEYQRYLDLTNQMAENFPTLVKGYDDQGNAILGTAHAMEDMNDAITNQKVSAAYENLQNAAKYADTFEYGYNGAYHGDQSWFQQVATAVDEALTLESSPNPEWSGDYDIGHLARQSGLDNHTASSDQAKLEAGSLSGQFKAMQDVLAVWGDTTKQVQKEDLSTNLGDEAIKALENIRVQRPDKTVLKNALEKAGIAEDMWDDIGLDDIFDETIAVGSEEYRNAVNNAQKNAQSQLDSMAATREGNMANMRSLMQSQLDLMFNSDLYNTKNLSDVDKSNISAITQAMSAEHMDDLIRANPETSVDTLALDYAKSWVNALQASGPTSLFSSAINDLLTLTDNSTISDMRKATTEDLATISKALPNLDMGEFMKDLKLDEVQSSVHAFDDLNETLQKSQGLMGSLNKPGVGWEGWTPTPEQNDQVDAFTRRLEAWADSRHVNTQEEFTAVNDALTNLGENINMMNWGDFEEYMDVATFNTDTFSDRLSVLSQGVTDFRKVESDLSSLMATGNTLTGLDSEGMNQLISDFEGLEGFDASKLFEFSGTGIKANARYLNDLNDQLGDLTEKQYSDEIKDLQAQLVSFDKAIASTNDASKRSQLVDQRDMIANGIEQARANLSEVQALNSEAQQFVVSMQTGGRRAAYETIGSAFDNVEKLYQSGYVGSEEFRKAVQLMVTRDMSNASVEELVQTYNDNIKNYKALTNRENPIATLHTGEAILRRNGLFEDGEVINVNGVAQRLGTIRGTRDEIAAALDLDPSLTDSWIQMAEDMGLVWINTGEEATDALSGIKAQAEEAKQSSDQFSDIDLGASSLSDVNEQLEKLENKNIPDTLKDQYDTIQSYLKARKGELTTADLAKQYEKAQLDNNELSQVAGFSDMIEEATNNLKDSDIRTLKDKYGKLAEAYQLSFDNVKDWDVKDFADVLHDMNFDQAKEFLSDIGIKVDDSQLQSLLKVLDEVKTKIDGINESEVKPKAEEARGELEEAGYKNDVDKYYEGKSDKEVQADLQQKYNEANHNARLQGLEPSERDLDSNVGHQIQQENKVAQQQQEAANQQKEAAQSQEKSAQTNQQVVKEEQKQVQGPQQNQPAQQSNKEQAQQHMQERAAEKAQTAAKLIQDNVEGFKETVNPKPVSKPGGKIGETIDQPVTVKKKEQEEPKVDNSLKNFRKAQEEVQKGTAKVAKAWQSPVEAALEYNEQHKDDRKTTRKTAEKAAKESSEKVAEDLSKSKILSEAGNKIGNLMSKSATEAIKKKNTEQGNDFFDGIMEALGLKPTTAKASDYNGELAPGYENEPQHDHELSKKSQADQVKGFRSAEKGEVEVEGKVKDVDTSDADKGETVEVEGEVKDLDTTKLQNIGDNGMIDVTAKVGDIDQASLQNIGSEGEIDVTAKVGDIDTAKLQNVGDQGQIELTAKVGDIDTANLQNVGDDAQLTVNAKVGSVDTSTIQNAQGAELSVNAKVDSIDKSVIENENGSQINVNAIVDSVDDSTIQALNGSEITIKATVEEGNFDSFIEAKEKSTVNVTVQVKEADMSGLADANKTIDVTAKVVDVDTASLDAIKSQKVEVQGTINWKSNDIEKPDIPDETGWVTYHTREVAPADIPDQVGWINWHTASVDANIPDQVGWVNWHTASVDADIPDAEGRVNWGQGHIDIPTGLQTSGVINWKRGSIDMLGDVSTTGWIDWHTRSHDQPTFETTGWIDWHTRAWDTPGTLSTTGSIDWISGEVPPPAGLQQSGTVTWGNSGAVPDPAPLQQKGTVTWVNKPVPTPSPLTATGTVTWRNNYSPPNISDVTATVHWRNDTSGVSAPTKVNGTAHATGTAIAGSALAKGTVDEDDKKKKHIFSSFLDRLNWNKNKKDGDAQARGNWGLKQSGINLVGELGRELVVRGSKWFTVGDNGAEMRKLQKGDIIFNHLQTEEIFKKGYVTSGGGRGKPIGGALAEGTALLNGWPRDRHKDYTSAADYYLFDRAFALMPEQFDKYKDPNTINIDWSEFIGSIYNASQALNVARNSAIDMSQAFNENVSVMDYVAQVSTRLGQMLNNADILFQNTFMSTPQRMDAGLQKQQLLYNQQQFHKEARDKYWAAARGIGLDENTMNLAKEGSIDIQVLTDQNLAKKIQQFMDYYNKGREEETAMMQSQLDIQQHMLALQEARLVPFQQREQSLASQAQQYSNKIDIVHAKGHFAGRDFYQGWHDSLRQEQSALEDLISAQASDFNSMMAEGTIQQGSEEYNKQVLALMELNEQWQELTKNIYETEAAVREEEKAMYDWSQDQIDQMHSENDFVRKLFGTFEEDMFAKSSGRFNINGGVMISTHAMDYNMYLSQAEKAATRAQDLYQQMAQDNFNPNMISKDVIDEYNEARQAQMDYISSAIDEKKAIQDLYENQYDHMLKVLDKVIDKKKEQLEAEKDLYDYQKKIQNQVDDINELEKIYLSLQNDDSEEGKARRQEVKNQLDEANEELQDMEYEQWLSDQEQIMDDYYNAAEETFNARLQEVEDLLAEANALLSNDWHAIDKLGYDTEGEANWLQNSKEEWNHLVKDNINDVTGSMGFQLSEQLDELYSTVTEPSVRNLSDQFTNLENTTRAVDGALDKFTNNALAYATQLDPNKLHPEATNAYENEVSTLTSPVGQTNAYNSAKATPAAPAAQAPAAQPVNRNIEIGAMVQPNPGAQIFDQESGGWGHTPYFSEAYGYGRDQQKYTVLKVSGGRAMVSWFGSGGGVTGWFNLSDLVRLSTGGYTGNQEGLAYLHPQEMILNQKQFTNFARLTELIPIVVDQFKKNSILGTISDGLLNNVTTESNDNHATNNNNIEINVTMNDVQNPQQFVNELRTNREVIRAINDITEAKLTKNSKLGQRKRMSAL